MLFESWDIAILVAIIPPMARHIIYQTLEINHGRIAVVQTSGATSMSRCKYLEIGGRTRRQFRFSPTPGLTPTGMMLRYQPTPVNLLAKGLSMNTDRCHDEAQFHWLRYQLDSCVKILPTVVAEWLEHWWYVV